MEDSRFGRDHLLDSDLAQPPLNGLRQLLEVGELSFEQLKWASFISISIFAGGINFMVSLGSKVGSRYSFP